MQLKIINSILLSTLCFSAVAATENAYIAAKVTEAPVLDLAYNGSKMVAVGDRGHLLAHVDNDWRQISSPSKALLTAITFDGKKGWAVGHDATILASNDGGFTWTLSQSLPELDKPLLDVEVVSDNTIIAVGAYGLTFVSNNAGKDWQQRYFLELLHPDDQLYLEEIKEEDEELYNDELSAMLPHFNRIQKLADGRLIIVGEMGLIAISADGGATWTNQEPFYDGSLFDFVETANGSWIAVGLRGNIFRSVDQGVYWEQIETDVNSTINSVAQLSNGEIVMVANSGYVLVSKDDGQTFVVDIEAKGQDLVTVAEDREGRVLVAGSDGIRRIGL